MKHLHVHLDYTLHLANGQRAPTTQAKNWFFEVPDARADQASMNELLHRIFFDANVAMRMREPGDRNYLGMVAFSAVPVDLISVKDGKSDYPWIESQKAMVWEPGPCFVVSAEGKYDVMGAHDFTELLINRLYEAKQLDDAGFLRFFETYFKNADTARKIFGDRVKRLANLTTIREGPFRKFVGGLPISSGPVDAAVASMRDLLG